LGRALEILARSRPIAAQQPRPGAIVHDLGSIRSELLCLFVRVVSRGPVAIYIRNGTARIPRAPGCTGYCSRPVRQRSGQLHVTGSERRDPRALEHQAIIRHVRQQLLIERERLRIFARSEVEIGYSAIRVGRTCAGRDRPRDHQPRLVEAPGLGRMPRFVQLRFDCRRISRGRRSRSWQVGRDRADGGQ
jgi:hypothetical protein